MDQHVPVIVAYARTPFTPAYKGALAKLRADDMSAQLIKTLVARTSIIAEDIEDVLWGCAFPEGEQGLNVGRIVALMAGLPDTVGGVTINRFCGSSMEAIHTAAGKIAMGAGQVFVCGGVESMTRTPMGGYNPLPNPALYDTRPEIYMGMGLTAEAVAERCGVSREQQEAFAVSSHHKAASAPMLDEIIPVSLKGQIVERDGCIRPDTTTEALAGLKPAFKADGVVTAGTSSPLTDGAAAVIVCSLAYAKAHALPVLARIAATAVSGLAPEFMGLGPIDAANKAMQRAGITSADLAVVELNEAFAAQAIPCVAQLGVDAAIVNLHGGAIALGHPLGASGARITGKAAQLLHDKLSHDTGGGAYALSAMCIGGGQGIATILAKV